MAEVRLHLTGSVKDYETAVNVFNRASEVAAATMGAEVWEAFIDKDTGKFVLIEAYASEEAFLEYEDEVTSAGIASTFREALKDQSLVFLSTTEHELLNRRIDSWKGIRVTPVASM